MRTIVLRQPDKAAQVQAKKLNLGVVVSPGWELPAEEVLFASEVSIPWDLVGAGFSFLEHWDLAAPLWFYGRTAEEMGTPAERKRTEAVILDLRVLLYAHELLFVRASEAGRAFLAAWREECQEGDERLAFLRALHRVKPRFLVLPTTWLADVQKRSEQDMRIMRHSAGQQRPLVRVEIRPNTFVTCQAGDEERVRAHWRRMLERRGGR